MVIGSKIIRNEGIMIGQGLFIMYGIPVSINISLKRFTWNILRHGPKVIIGN